MFPLSVSDAPLAYTFACIVVAIVFNWWYRSRKLNIRYGDEYVLITGCDSGFGRMAAVRFDKLGFNVFAACYSRKPMMELSCECSTRLSPLLLDVTNEESVEAALASVKKRLPPNKGIWAVINNAGVMGTVGACEWLKKKHYKDTLNVNALGMISVTKAFLPLLRQCQGRVVVMVSALGRFAMTPAAYSVSKFCAEGWANCLRHDLWDLGVSVHLVAPGGYRTNITDGTLLVKSMDKAFDELDDDIKTFYGEQFKTEMYDLMTVTRNGIWGKNLEEVVDVYVHAVTSRHPKTRYVVGLNGNLIFRPLWMLPTRLTDFLMGMSVPQPAGLGQVI
ncbi:retinol dehydrogenase 7 [Elysia marginata]|uniref:Retinol dehydrogenase 7 n=1 Tax=Elysia marginata TaxID=1093978 RepID=A0AAV4HV65_9GAST|nr:retinol dehydrogenase 7 [Elysia marginata]